MVGAFITGSFARERVILTSSATDDPWGGAQGGAREGTRDEAREGGCLELVEGRVEEVTGGLQRRFYAEGRGGNLGSEASLSINLALTGQDSR